MMNTSIYTINGTWVTGLPASDYKNSDIVLSMLVDGDHTILAVEKVGEKLQYVVKNDYGFDIKLGQFLPPLPEVKKQMAILQDRIFIEQGGNDEQLFNMMVGTIKMTDSVAFAEQVATDMNLHIMDFTSDTINNLFFIEKSEDGVNQVLCWYYENKLLNKERFLALKQSIYEKLETMLPEDMIYPPLEKDSH